MSSWNCYYGSYLHQTCLVICNVLAIHSMETIFLPLCDCLSIKFTPTLLTSLSSYFRTNRTYITNVSWFPMLSFKTHLPLNKTAQDNYKCTMKMVEFRFEFHWNLFPGVQLKIRKHSFGVWIDAEEATSHYLNQCWPSSLTHLCGTRGGESSLDAVQHL